MNNPIKMAIVGLGRAGWGMHVPELANKPEMFEIIACCDIIPERNEAMKKRFGCKTYASIEELVNDPEVDIVDIATRSCDHFAHAKLALTAGKNVLLEKPACVNISQLDELLTISNKPGMPRIFFRQNRRFEEGFKEIKRIIASGIIGNVFELRLSQSGYDRRDDWQTLSEYGGGQMLNWGPHLIDHALQLIVSPVARVNTNSVLGAAAGDCEDHFSLNITGKNGRYATVTISGSDANESGRTYTAIGSKGTVTMHNNKIKLKYINPEQNLPPVHADAGTPANEWGASGTFEALIEPEWIEKEYPVADEDLSVFWIHLYEAFREIKPFPVKDEEVRALMQVITEAKSNAAVRADSIR